MECYSQKSHDHSDVGVRNSGYEMLSMRLTSDADYCEQVMMKIEIVPQ